MKKMPSDKVLDVKITGNVVAGHNRDNVVQALASTFKITEERAEALLSGEPRRVKADCRSAKQVELYQRVLKGIGVEVLEETQAPTPSGATFAATTAPAAMSSNEPGTSMLEWLVSDLRLVPQLLHRKAVGLALVIGGVAGLLLVTAQIQGPFTLAWMLGLVWVGIDSARYGNKFVLWTVLAFIPILGTLGYLAARQFCYDKPEEESSNSRTAEGAVGDMKMNNGRFRGRLYAGILLGMCLLVALSNRLIDYISEQPPISSGWIILAIGASIVGAMVYFAVQLGRGRKSTDPKPVIDPHVGLMLVRKLTGFAALVMVFLIPLSGADIISPFPFHDEAPNIGLFLMLFGIWLFDGLVILLGVLLVWMKLTVVSEKISADTRKLLSRGTHES